MCQTTQKSYDIKKSRIELFNKMREWCLDRWHDCYWIIPYDWRLGQIWYKFSCRFWHKYSTVKPRTLGHTWVDRDNLLAHTSFEILSDFVENEYPNSHIDFYDDHPTNKIEINGVVKYEMDELLDLYSWWNETYLKEYREVEEIIRENLEKTKPEKMFNEGRGNWINFSQSDEYRKSSEYPIYRIWSKALSQIEENAWHDLDDKLKRLINARHRMWT